jgi:Mg2+ and Co2+ transporter CorA
MKVTYYTQNKDQWVPHKTKPENGTKKTFLWADVTYSLNEKKYPAFPESLGFDLKTMQKMFDSKTYITSTDDALYLKVSVPDELPIIIILSKYGFMTFSEKGMWFTKKHKIFKESKDIINEVFNYFSYQLSSILDRNSAHIEHISSSIARTNRVFSDDLEGQMDTGENKTDNFLLSHVQMQISEFGCDSIRSQRALEGFEKVVFFLINECDRLDGNFPINKQSLKDTHMNIQALQNTNQIQLGNLQYLSIVTSSLINTHQHHQVHTLTRLATILMPPSIIVAFFATQFQLPSIPWYVGYPLIIMVMSLAALISYRVVQRRERKLNKIFSRISQKEN